MKFPYKDFPQMKVKIELTVEEMMLMMECILSSTTISDKEKEKKASELYDRLEKIISGI